MTPVTAPGVPPDARLNEWESGRLGFVGLLRVVWTKKLWVIATTLVSIAGFGAAAFLMTPVYRSTAVLMPATTDRSAIGGLGSALGQLGGLAALAGVKVGGSDPQLDEAFAVFKSREFTDRFIAENGLIQKFFAKKWDPTTRRWKVPPGKEPTAARAYEYFDNEVRTLTRDTKTGTITLKIEWRNRVEAAAWANDLVGRINLEMRQRAAEKANASLAYLQSELKKTEEVATREAIYRLIEAQVKQRMLANVTNEYAFQVIDPALVSDPDAVVRPRKAVLLVVGLFVGVAAGIAVAVLVSALGGLKAALRSDPT